MENIYYIREIRRIYAEYLAETVRMEAEKKITDGLLGFGKGLGSAPTHDLFSDRLDQALVSLAANSPASQEALEVLRFIYDAPKTHQDNALAYWMLMAVHALTDKLIVFLSQENAAALAAAYQDAFPRAERLPAQNKIAELLRKQAGQSAKEKRRSLLDRLRGRGN